MNQNDESGVKWQKKKETKINLYAIDERISLRNRKKFFRKNLLDCKLVCFKFQMFLDYFFSSLHMYVCVICLKWAQFIRIQYVSKKGTFFRFSRSLVA